LWVRGGRKGPEEVSAGYNFTTTEIRKLGEAFYVITRSGEGRLEARFSSWMTERSRPDGPSTWLIGGSYHRVQELFG